MLLLFVPTNNEGKLVGIGNVGGVTIFAGVAVAEER